MESLNCGRIAVPTKLSNLTTVARIPADYDATRLVEGYQPQKFDVICGGDKDTFFHVGNNRFRLFVDMRVDKYLAAKTRPEKTRVVKEVIDMVRASGGLFIQPELEKEEDQQEPQHPYKASTIYYDIGLKKTIDKAGHAIRRASKARQIPHKRNSWSTASTVDSSLSGSSQTACNPRRSLTAPIGLTASEFVKLDREGLFTTMTQAKQENFESDQLVSDRDFNPGSIGQHTWKSKDRTQSWDAGESNHFDSAKSITSWRSMLSESDENSLSSHGWNVDDFMDEDPVADNDDDNSVTAVFDTQQTSV